MARRRVRIPAWLAFAAAIAAAVLCLVSELSRAPVAVPEGDLAVHFIDVGQGDAALLVTSGGAVMIDAGPRSAKESTLGYVRAHTGKIDLMILTHPHEDHIGGAAHILGSVPTAKVVMPDVTSDTETFEGLLDAIEDSGSAAAVASAGDVYDVGGMRITILAPLGSDYDSMNDYSIVCRVDYGERSFMFTGDAETASENEILDACDDEDLRCDVLKVGHHGSSTSSSKEFLEALRPQIAVISLAADNSYGHPHSKTLKRLKNAGVSEIYRTDTSGTVVLVTDGHTITAGGRASRTTCPGFANIASDVWSRKRDLVSPRRRFSVRYPFDSRLNGITGRAS